MRHCIELSDRVEAAVAAKAKRVGRSELWVLQRAVEVAVLGEREALALAILRGKPVAHDTLRDANG